MHISKTPLVWLVWVLLVQICHLSSQMRSNQPNDTTYLWKYRAPEGSVEASAYASSTGIHRLALMYVQGTTASLHTFHSDAVNTCCGYEQL